jgi:hypothetical protein
MSKKNEDKNQKVQQKGKSLDLKLTEVVNNFSLKIFRAMRFFTVGFVIRMMLFVTIILSLFIFITLIYKTAVDEDETDPIKTVFPSPTPQELPHTQPSFYSTDSAVVEIELEIEQSESDLKNVDLEESELTPPLIDFNVNFKKK